MKPSIRILLAVAAATVATVPAQSSAFTAGTVTAIAPDDGLNIRKWPGANSKIIDVYLLGEPISLTGRCKNIITNVSFRIDGGGSAAWKYAKMKKANVWCQVMTDAAELGWARGTYIWPE
ncbi:MAG: SH3 domain-containing protein [Hoeflea sp.]|uniref:SH3 domain-containing protein n=1 Tax=Hoeflea sp. TaxID=1940281 RepID=UPI002730A6A3|nr:SH3 domain-containing protein [Hoeflea sp.]MDP2118385.1 SH3 domain-containing protein [Hoeflea sp.]